MDNRLQSRVLLAILLSGALSPMWARPLTAEEAQPAEQSVRMVIDYGDGVEKHFTALPWRAEMTVFDALNQASKHPRGVRFESTGRGATLFVGAVDGVKNQGGTGDKNWIFLVNDKKGTKSCAVTPLKPGDVVRWSYEAFQY